MTDPPSSASSACNKAMLLAVGVLTFASPALAQDFRQQAGPITAVADRRDAGGAPADQAKPSPPTAESQTPSRPPTFSTDQTSEADCYYVFGNLRCDRVRPVQHGQKSRPHS